MIRTAFASVLLFAAGVAVLALETDGFAAFTTETARRLAVARTPVPVPSVALRDSTGDRFFLPQPGRPMLVEFIYSSCPTLCVALGDSFARIQERIRRGGGEPLPQLLSVSFDPARDDQKALQAYAEAHGADPAHWRVAVPERANELRILLETFGVVVIPDGEGGFVHNAALHLVDAQGRLSAIFDPEEIEPALRGLRR